MKKLGLVLGSGGSRGVAHIGFLKALEENGIKPYCFTGCSMGAVVGACYLTGMTTEQMFEEVKKLKLRSLADLSLNPIGKGGLLKGKKMRKKLSKFLPDKSFKDLETPFSVVATDVNSGQTFAFKGDEKIIDGVIASSSLPSIFKPAQVNGRYYVDGGVRRRLPVDEARDLGAEVVVAIDVLGKLRETNKKHNVFSLIARMFDITDYSITELLVDKLKPDLYIEPDMADMSQYKFEKFDFAYEAGYKAGLENIEKIKKLCDM